MLTPDFIEGIEEIGLDPGQLESRFSALITALRFIIREGKLSQNSEGLKFLSDFYEYVGVTEAEKDLCLALESYLHSTDQVVTHLKLEKE